MRDGQWDYFDENGTKIYSEYWEDGNFIVQIPEQNKTEIWKVSLFLNDEDLGDKTLHPKQLRDLRITPHFKNSSMDDVDLSIQFEVAAVGRKYYNEIFSIDSFKLFDLNDWLVKNGFQKGDQIDYYLKVVNKEKTVASFKLNIVADLPESKTDKKNINESSKTTAKSYDFYLVNSLDSTKRVELKVKKIPYDIVYWVETSDSIFYEREEIFTGELIDVNDSVVKFKTLNSRIFISESNGIESEHYHDYSNFGVQNNGIVKYMNLKDLDAIKYSNPTRIFFQKFGSATTFLSALTAIFVAPLASINYKNGGFNKDRYFTLAGSGLIGLSVGIPIIIIGQPKSYNLAYKKNNTGKKLWYIQSQLRE